MLFLIPLDNFFSFIVEKFTDDDFARISEWKVMGLEMKKPENCENSLRNRKNKENVGDKSEKISKIADEVERQKVEHSQREILKTKEETDRKVQKEQGTHLSNVQFEEGDKNFRIRIEFDPISIALLTLAIVTRFFRLSEPRNVVWAPLNIHNLLFNF